MAATISERRRIRPSWDPTAVAAYTGAAAFGAASTWYLLAVEGVTVAREPHLDAHQSSTQRYRIFYDWVVSTLPQERWYVALAILGFGCLAGLAIGTLPGRGPAALLPPIAAVPLTLGAALWIVGNVAQLGGHRAVGLMATHGNPLPTVGSIYFTIEMIDDAFETAAFATIGVALLLMGRAGRRSGRDAWSACSALLGGACLALAVAYILDEGDIVNLLLVAIGVALMPVWLVWTGRLLQGYAHAQLERS